MGTNFRNNIQIYSNFLRKNFANIAKSTVNRLLSCINDRHGLSVIDFNRIYNICNFFKMFVYT